MSILIKQATILQPGSSYHEKKRDVLIERGVISSIKSKIDHAKGTIVQGKGAYLSTGWVDMGALVGDPGFEQREDVRTLSKAALAGGFTEVAVWPNTQPVIDNKSEVVYLQRQAADTGIQLHPIGAISPHTDGKELTEMMDMNRAGAIAFSDGKRSIQDGGVMLRALQYAKAFNGLIINHPHAKSINPEGQVHEGFVSTSLGMKGLPRIAEELMVQRDLDLLRYAESKLHIYGISSARSIQLIKAAKREKLNVTTSVPFFNLLFTEDQVSEFDGNYKVLPPLREKSDRKALIAALIDGTIDLIVSNHTPRDQEEKFMEFPYAAFGATGLQTLFPALNTALSKKITPAQFAEILSKRPRRILGLQQPTIEEGQLANLTLFDPNHTWTLSKKDLQSRSKNTPFVERTFTGKVRAVISQKKVWEF